MADRIIENDSQEVPEIPEALENVLLFALDEAKTKMLEGDEVVPFTVLAVKENLFVETHPGDNPTECYNLAQHTVQGARGADAYALCYDGYVETDDGNLDVLIAEGGVPGNLLGYAIGYIYTLDEDTIEFESEPVFIGDAPNFMGSLSTEPFVAEEAEAEVEEVEEAPEGEEETTEELEVTEE